MNKIVSLLILIFFISCNEKENIPLKISLNNNWKFKGKDTLNWIKIIAAILIFSGVYLFFSENTWKIIRVHLQVRHVGIRQSCLIWPTLKCVLYFSLKYYQIQQPLNTATFVHKNGIYM